MGTGTPSVLAVIGLIPLALAAQDTLEPGASACMLHQRPAPYPALRQANVAWERRVWRVIDLRDDSNSALRSTLNSTGCPGLFQVIRHGLLDEGAITAFDPGPVADDDAFQKAFTRAEVAVLLAQMDHPDPSTVARYMIKEDWIFDKERGLMDVRIIGIAPCAAILGVDSVLREYKPLFWLHYPECRILFARWVALGAGDGAVSFEQVFARRRFTSTVVKISSGMGRAINTTAIGSDAVLESEAVREQLFRMGFDLWNY